MYTHPIRGLSNDDQAFSVHELLLHVTLNIMYRRTELRKKYSWQLEFGATLYPAWEGFSLFGKKYHAIHGPQQDYFYSENITFIFYRELKRLAADSVMRGGPHCIEMTSKELSNPPS